MEITKFPLFFVGNKKLDKIEQRDLHGNLCVAMKTTQTFQNVCLLVYLLIVV
jgi:hypothetical protein